MDLQGSLPNTEIKIVPSIKFREYLKNIDYQDGMPENIVKLTKPNDSNYLKSRNEPKDTFNLCLSEKELKLLKEVIDTKHDHITESNPDCDTEKEADDNTNDNMNQKMVEPDWYLKLCDLDWLFVYLQRLRDDGQIDIPYLHELLEGAQILTPANTIIKRNPALEARCVKLRSQQEAREYRAMTKGVDNVRIRFPEDTIAYQLKQLNRQLIAVGQFLISIFAGFLFGFKGIDLMIGSLDFGFRLLLGVMCALIIALAEIYFLAKKLNEELSIPETTQLGGPPKFVNQQEAPIRKVLAENVLDKKEHQD